MDTYKDWTDEKLDEYRLLIIAEQERRIALAEIPDQIAVLAKTYRDGGGDEQSLTDALTPDQIAARSQG